MTVVNHLSNVPIVVTTHGTFRGYQPIIGSSSKETSKPNPPKRP